MSRHKAISVVFSVGLVMRAALGPGAACAQTALAPTLPAPTRPGIAIVSVPGLAPLQGPIALPTSAGLLPVGLSSLPSVRAPLPAATLSKERDAAARPVGEQALEVLRAGAEELGRAGPAVERQETLDSFFTGSRRSSSAGSFGAVDAAPAPMPAQIVVRLESFTSDLSRPWAESVFDSERGAQGRVARGEFIQALPGVIREHFFDTLRRYEHRVEDRGEFEIYEIRNGLEFWIELLSSPIPERRMAARVYLHSSKNAAQDFPARLMRDLAPATRLCARVLDIRRLTRDELSAVEEFARAGGLKTSRHGGYLVVGQGHPFHLTRQVFRNAEALTSPKLVSRFDRVARFMAAQGLPIVSNRTQGAEAFYASATGEISYVMPSRIDLNSVSHEVTHARFKRFREQLESWLERMRYAMPYEIDGPPQFTRFGALLGLVDELNAWRVGESFSGGSSDAKILRALRESYGRQVGWDNVRLFSRLWTPAKIRGKSVASLILGRVRALNRLDEKGLRGLGADALSSGDLVKAHDFLRLVEVRHPDPDSWPEELRALVQGLLRHPDASAARAAASLLGLPQGARGSGESGWREETRLILSEATPRAERETLLLRIVDAASAGEDSKQGEGMEALRGLFEAWGFTEIREPGREARPGHVFFSPSIDESLSRRLFDGRPAVHRLALANLIRDRTYPEEFPALRRRLAGVLSDGGRGEASLDDLWIARMFLLPDQESPRAHLAWGESAAEAVRQDPVQATASLEFAAEYYRIGLAESLPGRTWGERIGVRLDGESRREALDGIRSMSPVQRRRYWKAVSHLWVMLNHEDPRIRTAARHALAAYPGYLLGLEGRMLRVLRTGPSRLRGEVLAVVDMAEVNFFSPEIRDFILESNENMRPS
ncbi:MAG: hypothetical protein WC728_01040 [Elusimicrobiota bacterium]